MNYLQKSIRLVFSVFFALIIFGITSCGNRGSQTETADSAVKTTTSNTENGPVISFDKSQHEFGPLVSGEKVSYNFRFTNTGTAPLIIINVHSGCGCTVGDYPKEPIPPGGTGRINVLYNSAGRRGLQSEMVRVITNANPQEYILRITAEVTQN